MFQVQGIMRFGQSQRWQRPVCSGTEWAKVLGICAEEHRGGLVKCLVPSGLFVPPKSWEQSGVTAGF